MPNSPTTFVHMFNLCNDVEAMKAFYVDLLNMPLLHYSPGEHMDVDCGGFELMFFKHSEHVPVNKEWAWQPGWRQGTSPTPSFSVKVEEADFAELCESIRRSDVPTFAEYPEWRNDGYWGYSIQDPMGMTLELFLVPAERPSSTFWPADDKD